MKQFFKFMFASMLGTFLTLIVVFFILMGILTSVISMAERQKVTVSENTVLHISLDHPIADRTPKDPFGFYDMASQSFKKQIGLNDILANIEKAGRDDKIRGIYLDIGMIPAGIATIEEIRQALIAFKEGSGKWVLCYGNGYTQSAYYLGTVADQIYLHPEGFLEFKGINLETAFIKGTLEKLDVEPQVIRYGEYKGAVEPFIRDDLSEANREQLTALATSVWNTMVNNMASSRNIDPDILNAIADEIGVWDPDNALEHRFVDKLAYKDEVHAELRLKLGLEEDEDINSMPIAKYTNAPDPVEREFTRDRIAVIYASGTIMQGEGGGEVIGAKTLSKAIRDARKDEKVKAIVMRVNSPGGDALASDVILREVLLARNQKPFIVSMGDLAASGGYWISCGADHIVADPNTLTGSIGVFAMIPNMQGLFNEKLGITFDHVQTNANSDFISITKPLPDYQEKILEQVIDEVYQEFLERVSNGRQMTTAGVDEIAQGRVWSGVDAKGIGLVDALGSLSDAIDVAAQMAELENFRLRELPEQKNPLEQLFEEVMGGSRVETALKNELGEYYRYYEYINFIRDHQGVQARMPFTVRIY